MKQLLEEEEVEVPVSKESDKEPAKMETDEVPALSSTADVNMQDSKAENGVPESEDNPVQMETDAKVTLQYYIMKFIYDDCNLNPLQIILRIRENVCLIDRTFTILVGLECPFCFFYSVSLVRSV